MQSATFTLLFYNSAPQDFQVHIFYRDGAEAKLEPNLPGPASGLMLSWKRKQDESEREKKDGGFERRKVSG